MKLLCCWAGKKRNSLTIDNRPYILPPMKKVLSPTEAAYVMGFSRQRMHQLIKQGRVRGVYRVGRGWAIPLPVRIK